MTDERYQAKRNMAAQERAQYVLELTLKWAIIC